MKDIDGYPYYAITPDGLVWSHQRVIKNPNSETAYHTIGGRFLNPVTDSTGYKMVRLNNGGNKKLGKWFKVSRLVAKAFISNSENKPEVNHINGIKTDNRVENLEWCTQKENVQHAYSTGLAKGQKGTKNGNSKLSEQNIRDIRWLAKEGLAKSVIAQTYGIERYFVHRIINRQNWKHI